jgi:hypothetical protein
MTETERCNLRLKCAEPFIITGSKVSLSDETIFTQAEKLYQFVIKKPEEAKPGQA